MNGDIFRLKWFLCAALLAALLVTRGIAENAKNPENVFLSLANTPAMGDVNARVAVVEYGDYECPQCGQHAARVLPEIIANYVRTGKIRYFFKDAPIEAIHPHAFKAAEAAHCAGEQGKFWEMHDRLFKNQQFLTVNQLPVHASALGLDALRFQQCLVEGTYAAQIRKDLQDAVHAGARGTPTFFVGVLDSQSTGKVAITILSGAQPFAAFQRTLDAMLSDVAETHQ
jgi:protein-disulfide isomerase